MVISPKKGCFFNFMLVGPTSANCLTSAINSFFAFSKFGSCVMRNSFTVGVSFLNAPVLINSALAALPKSNFKNQFGFRWSVPKATFIGCWQCNSIWLTVIFPHWDNVMGLNWLIRSMICRFPLGSNKLSIFKNLM